LNAPNTLTQVRAELGASEDILDASDFHRLIREATADDAEIGSVLWRRFGHSPDKRLEDEDWARLESEFFATMSADHGADYAKRMSAQVFADLRATPVPATLGTLTERIVRIHHRVGAEFADLLIGFVHASLLASLRLGAAETVFLARDAIPFHVIAQALTERGLVRQPIALLDLNRSMIPTFSISTAPAPPLADLPVSRYLAARFVDRERIAIVDTGLYGTLIQPVLEMRLFRDPAVLFFASKNPNIYGYLNAMSSPSIGGTAHLDAFGEACCDTVETWPKPYASCTLRTDGAVTRAVSSPADFVSLTASLALYQALAQRARRVDLDRLDPRASLSRPMMDPLPRWEHAAAWLAAWRSGPLAPLA